MKSDYITRAKKFLQQIAPLFDDCFYTDDYVRVINWFNHEHNRKVICSYGLTRIALITSDYVIKFDYDQYEVKHFGGCKSEVDFYNFAKRKGYAHLFAKITPVIVNGCTYYIMPRINGIGRHENHYVQEYLDCDDADFVDEYLNDMHDQNYGWKNGYPVIIDYACNMLTFPRA